MSENVSEALDTYKTNPEKWLSDISSTSPLLCIVIFRGSWCKYDRHYLRKLGEYYKNFKKTENIHIIAWTSEGETGATKADNDWKLQEDYGYDAVIGDETIALAQWLIDDEILPDLVIKTPDEAKVSHLVDRNSYPNGIVMPGMVWYAHQGNIVFQWASPFDESSNMPGGPGRPEPSHLWKQVLKRKHALDHGSTVMPSHGTDIVLCSTDAEINSEQ